MVGRKLGAGWEQVGRKMGAGWEQVGREFFVRICYYNPSGWLRDAFGMMSGVSEKVQTHVAERILSRLVAPFERTHCPI